MNWDILTIYQFGIKLRTRLSNFRILEVALNLTEPSQYYQLITTLSIWLTENKTYSFAIIQIASITVVIDLTLTNLDITVRLLN